jgi:hypothetical protein
LLFHQSSDGDGLDSEATGASPILFSSAMITDVSLIIVCTIVDVFMILEMPYNFGYEFFSFA